MFFKRKILRLSRLSFKNLKFYNFNIYFLNDFLIINKFKYFFYINYKFIFINNFVLYFKNFFLKKFFNFITGTIRSILFDLIYGFKNFFFKKIILFGLNYKIFLKNKYIFIYLGYSQPLFLKIPNFIELKIFQNEIFLFSFNKQKIYFFTKKIKNIKKFSVYKLKGFKFYNEKISLKIIKKK